MMALALAGCPGGDDGDTGAGSTGQGSTSAATGSTGVSTTAASTSAGTAEGSSGSTGSGPGTGSSGNVDTGSSGSVDTGTTAAESTAGESTGASTGEPSTTTGPMCVPMMGSCAMGEMCCGGLDCCAGVPVPPGQEFCSNNCPISDYAKKRAFAAIDADDVLERVMALPITEWSYKSEDPSIRHLGPMAQDFKASFGLGATDLAIFQIDADGVALASIQALGRRLEAAEAENAALRESLASLEARMAALEGAAGRR